MNILEHYIKEVHEVKEFDKVPGMIEVDVTCTCYGTKRRMKYITGKKQWQKDTERGYFMA